VGWLAPSVATESPPGWIATEIPRPALGGGSGATLTQWSALRSPASSDVLLLACVATPIPGWVEDMRPSVEARTLAFASSSAERIVGVAVETHDEGGQLALRPVGATDDVPRMGVTRTFLGWTGSEVVTCFATCARPQAPDPRRPRACDVSVARARLEGGAAPPAPGLALGAVTWAVHHPSKTVLWGGLLTFFVGAVAVVSRRRPRSRI
jgi:hypothetical protein